MNIRFITLAESYFPLMLEWLEAPHVKKWQGQGAIYTPELVKEKYGVYIKGYKRVNGVDKPIQAYIICSGSHPIGYIQLYNAYDLPRDPGLVDLPESLGTLDIFIGDENYIGKDFEASAIAKFLTEYALPNYRYIFVDPKYENEAAVSAYEKAGFVILKRVDTVFWMMAHKKIVRLSVSDSIALEVIFRKCFLKNDRLWLFGSRVDLNRKGGDIDLYVETYAKTIDEAVEMQSEFALKLQREIGEQKIDVVLNTLKFPHPLAIHQVALTEGVRIL